MRVYIDMNPTSSLGTYPEKRGGCGRGGGGTSETRKTQAKTVARNAKTRCTVEVGAKKSRRVLGGEILMVTGHHLHTYRLPFSSFILETGPSQAKNDYQPTLGVSHTEFRTHTCVRSHNQIAT